MSGDDPQTKTAGRKGPAVEPHDMSWFEQPASTTSLTYVLYAACALVLVLDLAIPRHGKITIEHLFGFYAIAGAASCVLLAGVANVLARVLRQSEEDPDG